VEPLPEGPSRLEAPVQFLKGVGPKRAAVLQKLGVRTVRDLLFHFPSGYADRRAVTPLGQIRPGTRATVEGSVTRIRSRRAPEGGLPVVEVTLEEEDRRVELVWFGQSWRAREFKAGDRLLASGRVRPAGRSLVVEECEVLEGQEPVHAGGLVPSYPAARGLSGRQLRTLVREALGDAARLVPEPIPAELRERRRLPEVGEALRSIHAPSAPEEAERARRRFSYEEFLLIQAELALRRRAARRERARRILRVSDALDFRIRSRFPFRLTRAQERAVAEIRRDLAAGPPMNRLLQGDVGAGKTVVAAYALLAAVGNRAQAALLAPTEVLAEQHARTFGRMLAGSRVRVAHLAGGLAGRKRAELLGRIAAGEADLVIGTHAVIEEDVRFKDLALAVIDEQQKFGVLERASLARKGESPHVLVMTATPIPRTLALTLFGDLDLTVLDELPPGRREVTTIHVPPAGRSAKLEFVRRKLREGRQAYFVYPLVDDSDAVALTSAKAAFEELTGVFRGFRVALLHGRMSPDEKESVMEGFRAGAVRVLVSTLVIEVGVDVPNASLMVIDHAERYGLSQLHQLRGRIGRGPFESHCLLFGRRSERIDALLSTTDGFRIAEEDLRLRGPGEMSGTAQSGPPRLRAARLAEDAALLAEAREDAFAWVERDPSLEGAPALREALLRGAPGASLLRVG
jgi:ATP-dependent DNA helicase RecG